MQGAKDNKQINKILMFDSSGKKSAETLELDKDLFDGKVNKVLLYQAISMYRANQRRGTASTKTRAEVRGGGKKPWRQKGTGRARFASIRNPVWRGGGIAFGPHPRDFRYSLPKKMKRSAFIASLNAKLKSGKMLGVGEISLDEPKTREVTAILKKMNIKARALFLVKEIDRKLSLATRNIENLTVKKVSEATALDVLSNEHVVVTKEASEFLNKRIQK